MDIRIYFTYRKWRERQIDRERDRDQHIKGVKEIDINRFGERER